MRTQGTASGRREEGSFRLESQLCDVLSTNLLEALEADRGATMLSELQVGLVIPDLVVVSANARACLGQLTGFESWIVAELLRARSRRMETLASRMFARPEKTAEAILRLERRGAIKRGSAMSVSLSEDWFPRESEVIAVEAKLQRWREAVDQAAEYLRFANRSYVALPPETIKGRPAVAAACRERGLGLMSVSQRGAEIVRKAPRHRTTSPDWVWVIGRALATRTTEPKRFRERHAKLSDARELSDRETLPSRRL